MHSAAVNILIWTAKSHTDSSISLKNCERKKRFQNQNQQRMKSTIKFD